ncbi:hypothetical protein JI739_15380 [Ramlibacter sp. AW1]|uniref:Haemolysin-type calcium binding-related domain-containing protein n=1 Tax=Ramlibacter aurantiacus TaxID=2801330 RepID=A0A937D866_9BURK|nr:hypothetical protein [Ramlibacter aurantiacus]
MGADTYHFGRGSGTDVVRDHDDTPGVIDTIQLDADVLSDQLWFRQRGNHLELSILGTEDKMTVANWYLDGSYRVEVIRAGDGNALFESQVQNLVQAMASFAPPPPGQATFTPLQQAALAPLLAANWQ